LDRLTGPSLKPEDEPVKGKARADIMGNKGVKNITGNSRNS